MLYSEVCHIKKIKTPCITLAKVDTYTYWWPLFLEDTWRQDCSDRSGNRLSVYSSIPPYTCTPCFCLPHTPLPSPSYCLSHTYKKHYSLKKTCSIICSKKRAKECEITAGALPAGSTLLHVIFLISKCMTWAGFTHWIWCGITCGIQIFPWKRKST